MWLQTWVKQLTQEQILFLKVILLSSCMQPLFWFAEQKSIDCTRNGICNKVNLFSCNIILSVIFFNQDRDYCHWKQFNFVHLNLMDCSLRRQKGINRKIDLVKNKVRMHSFSLYYRGVFTLQYKV